MSFHALKSHAITTLDFLTPTDIWRHYGWTISDATQLDALGLTPPIRRTKVKLVNDSFGKFYGNDWTNVSPDEMENCESIGDFINLVALHANIRIV